MSKTLEMAMQLTFEIDDKLAEQFFNTIPKDEQKSAFIEMFAQYLQNKLAKKENIIIREGDDEVYGMWADKEIDVNDYVRELRKGRQF